MDEETCGEGVDWDWRLYLAIEERIITISWLHQLAPGLFERWPSMHVAMTSSSREEWIWHIESYLLPSGRPLALHIFPSFKFHKFLDNRA